LVGEYLFVKKYVLPQLKNMARGVQILREYTFFITPASPDYFFLHKALNVNSDLIQIYSRPFNPIKRHWVPIRSLFWPKRIWDYIPTAIMRVHQARTSA
jgi:hypothetical protein